MRALFACCVLSLGLGSLAARAETPAAESIRIMRPAGVPRFGLMGAHPAHPAPTLFIFATSLEGMQREPVFSEVGRILLPHGFIGVMLDPPAHGEDHRAGEPPEIKGWRARVEKGEDFMGAFTARAGSVLDYLIREGYADPAKVAACGTSRGGFLAMHLAAADPRVRLAAGISPLADPMAITEFKGTSAPAAVEKLALRHLASQLVGRPIWVTIGNHDTRVGSETIIAFTRAVVDASARPGQDKAVIPVWLTVAPTAGHTKIPHAHHLLAAWILDQWGMK